MRIAFTVCNRHQFRHALTLGESLLSHNPEFKFIVGWTDSAPLPELPPWLTLIRINELDRIDWQGMALRYYDFEFVAACKPFFARYILSKYQSCTELLYISPSTWVLGAMDSILNSEVFFQLTPHRLGPITESGRLDDKAILNMGMYHAGCWALHPDGQEKQLFDWWCERTAERAHFDLCQGMCLDQLWMNYLPALYSGIQPIRNPGWHYGLHAVAGHELSLDATMNFQVDQQTLVTVDFTGIEGYHPVWTDYADLIHEQKNWPSLLAAYRERLDAQKVPSFDPASTPYGKVPLIKNYRKQRKRVVGLLKDMIHRIETYDLTHN